MIPYGFGRAGVVAVRSRAFLMDYPFKCRGLTRKLWRSVLECALTVGWFPKAGKRSQPCFTRVESHVVVGFEVCSSVFRAVR